MQMMRRRAVWTTNLTGLLVGFGMFGSFILIPQLVEEPLRTGYGFGATVTEAGIYMLPSAAVMLVAGPIAGVLASRYGARLPLLLGTLLCSAAFGVLAVLHSERWHIYLTGALMGVGIGFAFASMANVIVEAVDQSQTGVATGMNTIMRTIGGSLGGQISASIVAGSVLAGTRLPSEAGFTVAFAISSVAVLLAFCAALAIPRARAGEAAETRLAA
jgi:MFS family permease